MTNMGVPAEEYGSSPRPRAGTDRRRLGVVAAPPDPDVTVLVTAHNEERRIRRALFSIRRQTSSNFRVVVVDDGSTDATSEVVRGIARRDARFRLVRSRHRRGVAAASNTGLQHCDTEFVARLDADDLMAPRRLQRQLDELRVNPAAVAVGTYGLRVNDFLMPLGLLRVGPAGREGYLASSARTGYVNVTHSTIMFRREAVERIGGYPLEYTVAEDLAMYSQLIALGEIYAIPELLTVVAIRANSLSAQHLRAEELAMRRIKLETQRRERFHSFDDFVSYQQLNDPRWEEILREIDFAIARRSFGRQLAAGRLLGALDALMNSGMPRDVLRATLRRVFSGR